MDKLVYDEQKHQEKCVANIIEVLKDTNNCTDFSGLEDSIKKLHKAQDIPESKTFPIPRLDILMETGTGKTYTYIKTMYEMYEAYGINRFVIFVPRKAIREGVIQNFKMTGDHFFQDYEKRINYFSYDGDGKVGGVKSFVKNDELSVLILTNHSVTSTSKNNKVLSRKTEDLLDGKSILDAIKEISPVVIIDEPHLLIGDKFLSAYNLYFSECLCLRFGATFPEVKEKKKSPSKKTQIDKKLAFSNAVFILDSLKALRDNLVKKIYVTTISGDDSSIKFISRDGKLNKISYVKDNLVKTGIVLQGDDLGVYTGLHQYNEVTITRVVGKKVYLSNKESHSISDRLDYKLSNESIRLMIRETIKQHFDKEEYLFDQNIKTLSLFFIPKVSDFRGDDPIIKNIFDEEYIAQRKKVITKAKGNYKKYLLQDFDENNTLSPVRGGYFSVDGSNNDEKVSIEVNKILKDKQRLLSTDDSLRFIFSVWALQEGWDNPNVFNICKLTPSDKDNSRRQQVGRGLRISVNNQGIRQTLERCKNNEEHFYEKNSLDMIVSSGEGSFIEEIQAEINRASYGLVGNNFTYQDLEQLGLNTQQIMQLTQLLITCSAIEFDGMNNSYNIVGDIGASINEHKEKMLSFLNAAEYKKVVEFFGGGTIDLVVERVKEGRVRLRVKPLNDFKELWDTITKTATISYNNIDESKIVESVKERFSKEKIHPVSITITKKVYDHTHNIIIKISESEEGEIRFLEHPETYHKFVLNFAKKELLPLNFVLKIFNKLDKKLIKNNPAEARRLLVNAVQDSIHNEVIQNIGYNFENNVSIIGEKDPLYTLKGKPKGSIKSTLVGKYQSKEIPAASYIYETIRYDSEIERKASLPSEVPEEIQNMKVKVFAKLPPINIPTPYKDCSPDFAYLLESTDNKKIYFVVETKGYDSINKIPPDEQKKIDYAKEFFKQLNLYNNKITKEQKIKIEFEPRITQSSLLDLLKEILKGHDQERRTKG